MTIDEIVGLMIIVIWIGLVSVAMVILAGGLVVLLNG
jgi:hypothetical protein